jgi:signal-transduction protein with cAMP-binding, CBS, and nucleotidyltransferase domain
MKVAYGCMACAMLLAIGCTSQLQQVQNNGETFIEIVCEGECVDEYGLGTTASCSSGLAAFVLTDTQRDCLQDLVERNDAARAFFDCSLENQSDLISCIEDSNQMCDQAAFQLCVQNLIAAEQRCGENHLTVTAAEERMECLD